MSRPLLQSPLARALILALAVSSLAAYVVNVSCSRPAPSATQAVAPYLPDAAALDAAAASAAASQGSLPGEASETPPPGPDGTPRHRLYGTATKSGFVIPRPRPVQQDPTPTNPAPNPAPNQAPKPSPYRFYGPATKSDIATARERAKEDARRRNPLSILSP